MAVFPSGTSFSVAVTSNFPLAPALTDTFPLALTVTVPLAEPTGLTSHSNFLLDTFEGDIVALIVALLPTAILSGPFNTISFASCLTVTVQLAAFLLPSFAVALIVALPGLHAVTFPFESTVATFLLLLLHTTSVMLPPSTVILLLFSPARFTESSVQIVNLEVPNLTFVILTASRILIVTLLVTSPAFAWITHSPAGVPFATATLPFFTVTPLPLTTLHSTLFPVPNFA